MELTMLPIGSWQTRIGDARAVPESAVKRLEAFLNDTWLPAFLETVELPWLSIRRDCRPSPIIRAEIAPTTDPHVERYLFEVEARPAGLGLVVIANANGTRDHVVSKISTAFHQAGCEGFVRTPESHIQDDGVCAQVVGVPYYDNHEGDVPGAGPLWVRSSTALQLEPRALGPIAEDGDKRYLVRLGLAQVATLESLDWTTPFAIKPARGTWSKGVFVYAPKTQQKWLKGSVGRGRIERELASSPFATYLVQPLIVPHEEYINGERGFTIWRIFFGWIDGRYQHVAGFWNWRPHIKVHGASDAVFGRLDA